MKRIILTSLLVLLATSAIAQTMGTSGSHDLDALWASAQKEFDLETEDAVLLLESRHVTLDAAGAMSTRIHRVVWINSSQGIRGYADLRVPWNSDTQTLEVRKLRTWMDGRWWPDAERISETAVVHTLPYAANHADAYTTLRESMLLHDGVELPCIMETEYVITEQRAAAPARDGLFVMPQRDPAVMVEYVLSLPAGASVQYEALNGAPEATESGGDQARTLTWFLTTAPALALPIGGQPAAYEPSIAWSTWESWTQLGDFLVDRYHAAAHADRQFVTKLKDVLDGVAGTGPRAYALAEWIQDSVRLIRTDLSPWLYAPRSAGNTWRSGYGHALDRAVLARGIFDSHDYIAWIEFVARDGDVELTEDTVPGLARLPEIVVWVSAGDGSFDGVFDPVTGRLTAGHERFGNRSYWKTGFDAPSRSHKSQSGADRGHEYRLDMNITGLEDEKFTGTGFLEGRGLLAPFSSLTGPGHDAAGYLSGIVAGVLEGAEVSGVQIFSLTDQLVSVAFDFTCPVPEGENPWTLGSPFGVANQLVSGALHLYDETRSTPLVVAGGWLGFNLRVDHEAAKVAWAPEPTEYSTPAGHYRQKAVEADDAWLMYRRLKLEHRPVLPAEEWPGLRSLLLDAGDPTNRTIVLEGGSE